MKKFKVISSLLALVMVLSMITVMPVSAATVGSNAYFCDFESIAVGANTNGAFGAEGLTMYLRDGTAGWGSSTIKEETSGGNRALATGGGRDGDGCYIYAAAPFAATKGKVYIGFEIKGSSFSHVKAYFDAPSTDNKGYYIAKMYQDVYLVSDAAASTALTGTKVGTRDEEKLNTWSYVQFVIDIDNNSWTGYLDGDKLGTYSFKDAHGLESVAQFSGFGFYTPDCIGGGLIDNISIVTDVEGASQTTVDAEGNTVITAVAPVHGLDNLTKNDITVTKCGSTETVPVDTVSNVANKLTITLADALDAGYEYVITFDGYDSIELYAYTEATAAVDPGSVYSNDFEDTVYEETLTFENKYTVMKDQSVSNILESVNTYTGNINGVSWYEITDAADVINGTKADGHAISNRITGDFYLLDNITETNSGIETYEFDYKLYGGSETARKYAITFNVDINGEARTLWSYGANAHENLWRHMKIEYDNDAQTLTYLKKDGTPTVIENVQSFDGRITIGKFQSAAQTVFIDNYTHYVTVANPLAVEKVRYTDVNGNVTGANTISPATRQIDITFSKEIDDAAKDAVTLTANGTPVGFAATLDSNVITLTILGDLPGNADVELTIPAAGRVYDVKTEKVTVTIGGLALTGAQPKGSMAANAQVTVTASDINATGSASITLIYAFYEDDELVAVDVATKAVTAGTTPEVSNTFTIEEAFSYDEVKAFAWDGLTTIVPLITSATVTE